VSLAKAIFVTNLASHSERIGLRVTRLVVGRTFPYSRKNRESLILNRVALHLGT
jgi:hypothetical protein